MSGHQNVDWSKGPLADVRVLDFGRYVGGPYCATLMGDFGADVIRVERPSGGEDRYVAPVTDTGEGAIFLQMGRNKRSLTLELSNEASRPVLEKLVASADVLVVNMPPSTLATLGLDSVSIRRWRKDIIHVNVSAFGADGPWSERLGFDSSGQCMSGAVALSGSADQPYRTQVNWVDFGTATHAAFAVMVALRERARTGVGQDITGALLATALATNNVALIEQAVSKVDRTAVGNRSFTSGPTDLFRTGDGWIMCHVVGNAQFRRWAKMVERPEVLDDPRFADDLARGRNGVLLSEWMSEWCRSRSSDTVLDALAGARIPGAPVLHPRDTLCHPQVQALGLFEDLAYPDLQGTAPVALAPVALNHTPATYRSPPPTLGEHSDDLLADLGVTAQQIFELRGQGAI